MYNFNMGYLTPAKLTPHSSVLFNSMENGYQHPWSIKNVGRIYEYGKYKELIPLETYLNLPAFLVDELLEGLVLGGDQRSKKDAENKAKADGGLTKEQKQAQELLKQAGLM